MARVTFPPGDFILYGPIVIDGDVELVWPDAKPPPQVGGGEAVSETSVVTEDSMPS